MVAYDQATLAKAKKLRREMTDAESKLWSILRNSQLNGAKFRRQQPIGPFIVDFVCQQARLIIEADGSQHADSLADARRTDFLGSKGYRVLRFWNNEIIENLEGVAESILAALSIPHPAQPAAESPSPSRGEGFRGAFDGQ
jgi:very-short-patch-repair endonuclease